MDSMFDFLTDIPLFRGVTRERIAQTVGSAKFHFLKFQAGQSIAEPGENCTHLQIILSGHVRVTITNSDGRLEVAQTLTGPDVIVPDFLFGPITVCPASVKALDDVSVIRISKNDYVNILSSDRIFLYNYLNYLSMNAQKCVEGVLSMTSGSIEERLAMWIIALTQPGGKDITVTCRKRDLNAMFGVSRNAFVAALDNLVDRGVITFVPGKISVHDRRLVLDVLRNGLE